MSKKNNKKICTTIGGQAVLEGVMMRGRTSMATAVRDQDGIVRIESKRLTSSKHKKRISKIPILRGVVSFVQSLVGGTKVLMRSAEVFGEGEPSKFEKWMAEKLKVNIMSVITTFSMILGLALAVLLFIWLPQFIRESLEICFSVTFGIWAKNFIEGGLKLLVFISYILLCSLLKDIRRTFMYHGAEHKTISCYEKGLDLTVDNARKCTRIHDRCGTTFMIFVMLISILTFACIESLIGENVEKFYRVLLKITLLPVVAGLSYELLKGLAKTDCFIVYPLKVPGMLLQKVTTREPDDKMIEVAIAAFKTVMEMDNDPNIEEKKFVVSKKCSELLKDVNSILLQNKIFEGSESEWIVSIILGKKRSEIYCDKIVSPKYVEQVMNVVKERITGRPLWYCIGDTDFYGYTIKVDERVLIPRPETEELVAEALKCIDKGKTVLDLCTGSGAIAIAIKKESDAKVSAADISEDALNVARENAKLNEAEIEFIHSNLFDAVSGENNRKFDVIVSNPPYIKTCDINSLQKEVREFEPILALDGGADGYDFYKKIISKVKDHLNENGVILFECGVGQAPDIVKMFSGFSKIEIINDYQNIERIIKAVL